MKDIVIIGGGIGGLCTAVRLLKRGFKVTILEKENSLGGKVNKLHRNRFNFDLTASILMSPNSYVNLFKDIGKDYKDYLEITSLNLLYRIYYDDKTFLDLNSDLKNVINTLENIEKGLASQYIDFLGESLNKYLLSKKEFLDKPMINKKEILNLKALNTMKLVNLTETSYKYISSKINNKKLKEYLLFKAMYIGINPYKNSCIYSAISAITQLYGLCYIKGGVYSYILALQKVIKELGGNIELNTEASKILIENKKVVGVRTKGRVYKCDVTVCNADYPYAIENLLSKEDIKDNIYNKNNIPNKEYSCSAFLVYLGLNKSYKEIKLHNIYINKDFRNNIEDAFNGKIPKNPSLYFYSPSAIDDGIYEKGDSCVNIMIRVPNLSFKDIKWDRKTILSVRNTIINTLKNIKGLENIEDNIVFEEYLTPLDLESRYNSYLGNAFGLSHKLTQTAYMRPHIKSKDIKGLYFIGSSTHPGNGISVIIDGSKILCDLINKDYKS